MQAAQKVEPTELIKFDAPELASIEQSKGDHSAGRIGQSAAHDGELLTTGHAGMEGK